MAKNVTMGLSDHPLSREENGVKFVVDSDDEKLGELIVSQGGLRWYSKNEKRKKKLVDEKKKGHFATWEQFAAFMDGKPRK
jgi:hypothetical protein